MSTDLRYPIGGIDRSTVMTPAYRAQLIGQIAEAPALLREAVVGLTKVQLDTPYRADGWTVRQVVAHVPDSHINAYVRFRWTLTEEQPTIKAYDQERWAELTDARTSEVETSLALLEALHKRWVVLLQSLAPEDFQRTLNHPEEGLLTLDDLLRTYAWHGRHHAAHIRGLRERSGW